MIKIISTFSKILFALVFALILFISLPQNRYLYRVLNDTIFKFRLGPDQKFYLNNPNKPVKKGKSLPWPIAQSYNHWSETEAFKKMHEEKESFAFLVIHQDSLIYEKYWQKHKDTSLSIAWSMSKSVISILIGAAIKDGFIKSEDDLVGKYIPEYANENLTIKHLLTMSSPITYYEAYKNPFAYTAKTLYGRPAYQTTVNYKMKGSPGKVLNYRSGETQLLSFVLSNATKQTIAEYASKKIWKNIGAENDALWALSFVDSLELAYCCLSATARDFAKIGQLWMHQGVSINGDTLVDPSFWERSIRPAELLEKNGEKNTRYGYQWWIGRHKEDTFYYMNGLNGQFVLCVPNKEMIVLRLGNKKSKDGDDFQCPDIYNYLEFGKEICALKNERSPDL